MSTEKNKTTKDKPPSEILLTRVGHIKDVHKVVSILFPDDADDPVLTRSQTWLRPTHATPLGKSASSASSTTSSSHEENDRIRIALNANATAIALSRLNVLVVCSVCNDDADEKGGDDNDTRQHQGVIEIQATKKNKTKNKDIRTHGGICVRSLAFVDFAHDEKPFLLVGLSSGRLEGYDCADVCSPRLLFSRKVSRAPLVSIRARPYGQRLGPKKESDDDDESAVLEEEEDVTIFAENGDVLRIDALEMKSHLHRLRMARKQYAQDFQPEKDDYNTLTGMVKFDGFKRIAPIRDGVCVGNVPLTCSEVGLRERSKSRLNTLLFNTSDDSDSDDDEKDENKFGFVACGKFGTIAFVQASGGSKFGAVEAVSMAAKKVFSFFAKKTKDIQKKRFDIVADGDDGDDDENESEEESENKTALKPSKWKSAIVDGPRKINTILNSPDGSFLATTDLLGRVSTYDCKYGNLSMRSLLKGCRDSDVGFINQRDLVVLSPHRGGGVIEYFPARLAFTKAVQMEKELVVGRDSRILSSARAFGTLFNNNTTKAEPEELYNTNSYLLGPDGNIDRISTLVS